MSNSDIVKVISKLSELTDDVVAGNYLPIGGTAANSSQLEGHSASYFATSDHLHTGVYAPASHTHSTTDITSGTLLVARGGTGNSSFTAGKFIVQTTTPSTYLKSSTYDQDSFDLAGVAAGLMSTHNSTYNHSNYDTAYGWGNHAGLYDATGTASGLMSTHESTYTHSNIAVALGHKTTEDAINGLVKCDGAGGYSAITDNSTNWNTAYGWGNHSGLYDIAGTAATAISGHESTYNHSNYNSAYSHISNNGTDHSYINQSVTSSASPSFVALTVSNGIITGKNSNWIDVGATNGRFLFNGSTGAVRIALQYSNETAAVFLKLNRTAADTGTCQIQPGGSYPVTFYEAMSSPAETTVKVVGASNKYWTIAVAATAANYRTDTGVHDFDGYVDAATGFKVNGTAGITSSFNNADGNTVFIIGGIITSIEEPIP